MSEENIEVVRAIYAEWAAVCFAWKAATVGSC
jgi:hypothetical protein